MKCVDYFDIQEYLEGLLKNTTHESSTLEFKSAAGGFPHSFWETYSSFANTNGGIIILGAKEKEDGVILDRLDDVMIDKYKKEFWSGINNKSQVNINILRENDVLVGQYKGKKFLVFTIPCAQRSMRPVYIGLDPYNGTYKRNYEGDYKCTKEEVRRMFADADLNQTPDDRILAHYSMEDIDLESLVQYRRMFSSIRPGHVWLTLDEQTFLTKLGGYRKDRISGREGFTLAGILMFGKEDSIMDKECAPHYFPDYREIPNDSSQERWTDRICPDGTWNANLFQFYMRVLPKLQASLPKPFLLKDSKRIDDSPSEIAIREAFVNTLIHADYSVNASIVIEQYRNKFVLSNPGTLLINLRQYYAGGESVARNKNLQKMFMMIGNAEKAGSGVDKIMEGWRNNDWKRPLLTIKDRPDKIVLTLSMESMLPTEVKDGLVQQFGKDVLRLNKNYIEALALAYSDGEVSNERLQFAVNMHPVDITRLLKFLCNKGFLVSEGIRRGTKYHLPNHPNLALQASNLAPKHANLALQEPNLAPKHANLALPKAKKISREKMEQMILEFCKDEYRSIEQIASHVERSSQYIKNELIHELLHQDKLCRLFPPKHPNQKYKQK